MPPRPGHSALTGCPCAAWGVLATCPPTAGAASVEPGQGKSSKSSDELLPRSAWQRRRDGSTRQTRLPSALHPAPPNKAPASPARGSAKGIVTCHACPWGWGWHTERLHLVPWLSPVRGRQRGSAGGTNSVFPACPCGVPIVSPPRKCQGPSWLAQLWVVAESPSPGGSRHGGVPRPSAGI